MFYFKLNFGELNVFITMWIKKNDQSEYESMINNLILMWKRMQILSESGKE